LKITPWRLQELPDAQLRGLGLPDEPSYGRRYAVFYNQVPVGEIEIAPDWKYSTQNPRVGLHVELELVRLLSFGQVQGFLNAIAMHISEHHPGTLGDLQTSQEIDRAMMSVLWQTQEISKYGFENEPSHGEIEVRLDGLASFYLDRRQALRNQTAEARQHR
jgi:hypothetical protein